jgi:hypothetical protein
MLAAIYDSPRFVLCGSIAPRSLGTRRPLSCRGVEGGIPSSLTTIYSGAGRINEWSKSTIFPKLVALP